MVHKKPIIPPYFSLQFLVINVYFLLSLFSRVFCDKFYKICKKIFIKQKSLIKQKMLQKTIIYTQQTSIKMWITVAILKKLLKTKLL